MVTLTLIQGVVNTFVIFFSRVAALIVMQFFRRNDSQESRAGEGIYYLMAILFQILFGILASLIVMWFSRQREFRADAGSAKYVGKEKMISALKRLQALINAPEDPRGPEFKAMKISDKPNSIIALLSSHPPLEARIAALQK
jgi:heat shock protein HtpX